jgi:Tfp pilus assembly protein PilF
LCSLFTASLQPGVHGPVQLRFRTTTAKSTLIEALQSNPEEAILHYNLACYDCQLGNLNDAKKHLTHATKADEKFKLIALADADLEPL